MRLLCMIYLWNHLLGLVKKRKKGDNRIHTVKLASKHLGPNWTLEPLLYMVKLFRETVLWNGTQDKFHCV